MNEVTTRSSAELEAEIQDLRAQLEAKTRVATRALATYQQRALLMEEQAAELRAANDEFRRVTQRLSDALRVLEDRDRSITNDLEQARLFQERILPDPPQHDRLAFSVFYRPAEMVGGDVYDIWERSPGVFRVFVADATGHGVQAALRTMLLKAEYDRFKMDSKTPELALARLNEKISSVYPGLEMQCTASCFDVALGSEGQARVRYATAAHPPLLHVRGEECLTIYQPGPFIGVVPEIELQPMELTLHKGDRLIVYSDGLAEQWNEEGQEFGIERVEKIVGDRSTDLRTTVDRLIDDWDGFLSDRRPADDATLIAIETLS